ncbi:fimbrial tip adhesin FimD [Prevotella dentasini]|uniref:fimbrial tip adhesin FimD n=1 Tax=Prevotella dentasini TaxID=589537 RepID=UPI0004688FE6|nr:fimbrial protein [Prevotella dentasini]
MKVSSYIYAAIASVFLLTLGACRAEEDFPAIDKEDCYQLQFGLSILPPQTRALTEEPGEDPLNENKISSMEAFIYDDAGVQKGYYSTKKGDLVLDIPNPAAAKGTATIYVPKTAGISASYSGHEFQLYVLVNYHGNETLEGKSLNDLKAVVMTTDAMVQSTVQPQEDFLMDGTMKTGTMTWASSDNYNITAKTGETLKLSRAAAKIRIRLDTDIEVKDRDNTYDVVGEPTISLKSYNNQTSLFAGSPAPFPTRLFMTEEQPMVKAMYDGKEFYARTVPYYSYENDWSSDGTFRTYAVIKLHIKSQTDGKESDTYYSVPLNYLAVKDRMSDKEIAGLTKLQRNHLYDIVCSIKEIGSAEPTKPVNIPYGYIAVEDWNNPDAIDAAITKVHYLVVKETHPEMLNVNERYVEYISDLDIDGQKMNQSIRYEYTQYNTDGTEELKTGTNKDGAIHIETEERDGKKFLKITSPIPDNYVPLTFKFRVTQVQDPDGSTPLYKDVVVTQYPPIYVTSKKSEGTEIYWYSAFTSYLEYGPNGAGYQSNSTLFKVTTLAPQAGQIVGDPTFGTDRTDRSDEANKITSPQFIIASQWGMSIPVRQYNGYGSGSWSTITNNFENVTGKTDRYRISQWSNRSRRYRDYSSADERAYNYWEDDYGVSVTGKEIQGDDWGHQNGTKYWTHTFKYEGHWRIPTLAELALIVKIQKDPKSAVKSLLWGHRYWSAQTGMGYDFDYGRNYPSNGGEMSIRPVFDTYNKSE